jgi:predicted HTH transcriptional regulator
MFGYEYEIVREFPNYFLDYREKLDETTRWSDRVVSNLGEWSGNLYDFYFKIYARVTSDIKTPFKLKNGFDRIDDTPMHEAIREAVTNALVHSNYYERRGLVIEKSFKEIIISNPGSMRISVDEAVSGGVSDTRNQTLMKMFALILIGERAGSGLYGIHAVWEENKLSRPVLIEQFNPDRVVLKLQIETEKIGVDKNTTQDTTQDKIMNFCSIPRSSAEIQEHLGLKSKKHVVITYLNPLLESGKIVMTIPDKPTSRNQKYKTVP